MPFKTNIVFYCDNHSCKPSGGSRKKFFIYIFCTHQGFLSKNLYINVKVFMVVNTIEIIIYQRLATNRTQLNGFMNFI